MTQIIIISHLAALMTYCVTTDLYIAVILKSHAVSLHDRVYSVTGASAGIAAECEVNLLVTWPQLQT